MEPLCGNTWGTRISRHRMRRRSKFSTNGTSRSLNFHRPCGVRSRLSTPGERAAECTGGIDAMGNTAAVTGPRRALERGGDDRTTGATGGNPDGHAGGGRNAKGEGTPLCGLPSEADSVSAHQSRSWKNQSQKQNLPMNGKQKHRPVRAVHRLPLVGTEESKQQKSKSVRRLHGGRFAPAFRLILP
jgi:hypothetical protein